MNRKMGFACTAIAILLAASILPVVGSEKNLQMENSENNSLNSVDENSETIEVPVQIYTLHGVKEIKKELPVNEARELFSLSNETGEAVKLLLSTHSTFREKIRANGIIDSFLYKMKGYGLLGNLSIKQARELITGKYLMKQRNNSIEMRKMVMMANFLNQNEWEVNLMSIFIGGPAIMDVFPWNALLWQIWLHNPSWVIRGAAIIPLIVLDMIPHPTTIGQWAISGFGPSSSGGFLYTLGLLGEKKVEKNGMAITIGFTGIVVRPLVIGFCPFIAIRG